MIACRCDIHEVLLNFFGNVTCKEKDRASGDIFHKNASLIRSSEAVWDILWLRRTVAGLLW